LYLLKVLNLDKQILHEVIEQYFAESNVDLRWMFENWDFLLAKKESLTNIAKKLNICQSM